MEYSLQKVEEELSVTTEINSRIKIELQSVDDHLRNTRQELSKAQKDLQRETTLKENLVYR